MKNNKIALLICVALLATIPLGVFAAKNLLKPTAAAGGYYSDVVDRVEFRADNTAFTFKKTTDGPETMQAVLTLTMKKCEPDFYAVLGDLTVEGMAYENAEFVCETPGVGDFNLPGALQLPVQNDLAVPLSFRVTLTFTADAPVTLTPTLNVEYTSGLTAATADERLLQIPLKITVT